jgi:hypothetical protein
MADIGKPLEEEQIPAPAEVPVPGPVPAPVPARR